MAMAMAMAMAHVATAEHTLSVLWLSWLLCSLCIDDKPPPCPTTEACFALADAFAHGEGRPKNEALARGLFARLCEEQSDGAACYNASALLDDSEPVRGVRYLEKACSANVLLGCTDLGIALREGVGVARDPVRARTLLTKACRGAVGEACAELADMWAQGEGGAKDAAKAKTLKKAACDLGDEPSCAR
ncbi:MAG: sel1 repeat family protein [Deltaproteobacteria bacterium]|nr:sel1 repeat family protein [Deltaproteobacteria bacterium]